MYWALGSDLANLAQCVLIRIGWPWDIRCQSDSALSDPRNHTSGADHGGSGKLFSSQKTARSLLIKALHWIFIQDASNYIIITSSTLIVIGITSRFLIVCCFKTVTISWLGNGSLLCCFSTPRHIVKNHSLFSDLILNALLSLVWIDSFMRHGLVQLVAHFFKIWSYICSLPCAATFSFPHQGRRVSNDL
jgi:hypothetical protein